MCGRYGRRADKQRIAAAMQAGYTNVFEEIAPSFNVAPQTLQPVVRLSRDSGERELALMRWGLIPWWAKDGKIGFSAINAKAETLTTSPAFREAFERRRCLVPAEWFYGWVRVDPKTKQSFAIALKDQSMFAFAGLWESWKDKATGERLYTYTIVTTDPNEVVVLAQSHAGHSVAEGLRSMVGAGRSRPPPRRSPPTISGRHDDGLEGEQGRRQRKER